MMSETEMERNTPNKPKRKRPGRNATLLQNTVALSVGRLGSKILVFLLVRFYTGVLTDAQFGTADLITNLANLLIPLACAGLSTGFFRFVAMASGESDRRVVFNSGLAILAGGSVLFLLLSPLLLLWDFFSEYVILVILYVIVANIHYFCTEYIRGLGMYRLFALQGIINTAINILLNLIFLLPFSLGVTGYVLSIVLADLFTSAFVIWQAKLWKALDRSCVRLSLIKDILRFSLPLIPVTVCWWIISVSDRYMVTFICGEGVNGLYTAAYKIPNLLTIFGNVFIEAWQFSAVVENKGEEQETEDELHRAKRERRITNFFSRVFRSYASLLFVMGGAMMMCSQLFAKVLFSSSFFAAWIYIPLLLVATVFSALANFVGSVYLVKKKSMLSLLTTLIAAVVNILFNFLLIPTIGAIGAACATLLAYVVLFVIRLVNARQYIPFRCQPTRLIISAVLMILQALFISPIWDHFVAGSICFILLTLNNMVPLCRSILHLLDEKFGILSKKTKKL